MANQIKVTDADQKPLFTVIVGNIGRVYEGIDYSDALDAYSDYVAMSANGYGRAANEPVTLWTDAEPTKEFNPKPDGYYED